MATEFSGSGNLQRSLELLWGTRPRPARGPRPGLNLHQIVTAAITVADNEGLAALSMRRVAAELGVGTMSLYRHVPGKGELLDLMLEAVSQPLADCAQATGWREVLEATARASWRLYLSHPWLLQVNWARPLLGPNALAGLNQVVSGLRGIPLTDQEKMIVVSTVDGLVAGIARSHVNALTAAEASSITDEEFWAAQLPMLERAMASGNYPALAELAEDSFGAGWAEILEFALQRLLDGIEVLIQRRTPSG